MKPCILLGACLVSLAVSPVRATDPPGPFTLLSPQGWDWPMPPLVFQWTASANASLYTLTVDDEPTMTPPHLAAASTLGTSFQFPPYTLAPPPRGQLRDYYWRVEASNDDSTTIAASPDPAWVNVYYVGCSGDANLDDHVNFADITAVLANYGASHPCCVQHPGDADRNGAVNFADITCVLANWGQPCW